MSAASSQDVDAVYDAIVMSARASIIMWWLDKLTWSGKPSPEQMNEARHVAKEIVNRAW